MAQLTKDRIAAAAHLGGWLLSASSRQSFRWRRAEGPLVWEVFVELTARGSVSYASLRVLGQSGRRAVFKGVGKAEQVIAALSAPETA